MHKELKWETGDTIAIKAERSDGSTVTVFAIAMEPGTVNSGRTKALVLMNGKLTEREISAHKVYIQRKMDFI